MHINLDLFGQVVITYSDVELWLENSCITPDSIPNRVKAYIKNYDVARKIAASKLSGDFYKLKRPRQCFDIDLIKEALKPEPPPEKHPVTGCPLTFHVCKNKQCEAYKAIKAKTEYRKRYNKKKDDRKAWLSEMAGILSAAV